MSGVVQSQFVSFMISVDGGLSDRFKRACTLGARTSSARAQLLTCQFNPSLRLFGFVEITLINVKWSKMFVLVFTI